MPKRSNSSFNCKLNSKYKAALNYKEKEEKKKVSIRVIANHFGISEQEVKQDEEMWREDYNYEMGVDDEWGDDSYGGTMCCGIDELNFENVVEHITKDTPKARHIIAKTIERCSNNDKRVLFVGLPLKKDGYGHSQYAFKNYGVIRRILMDFGFVQAHKRLYKNANSSNMLSVLVGQFP